MGLYKDFSLFEIGFFVHQVAPTHNYVNLIETVGHELEPQLISYKSIRREEINQENYKLVQARY